MYLVTWPEDLVDAFNQSFKIYGELCQNTIRRWQLFRTLLPRCDIWQSDIKGTYPDNAYHKGTLKAHPKMMYIICIH